MDVTVKHKLAWPHEHILSGVNCSRIAYDQLSLYQWVQRFCKNVLNESCHSKWEKMIAYMADLMEDVNDFTWQGAKVAHAVLCCELEQGTVTCEDSDHIDQIRHAHAQKHSGQGTKNLVKSREAERKPWSCKYYQNDTCHQLKGRRRSVQAHMCPLPAAG